MKNTLFTFLFIFSFCYSNPMVGQEKEPLKIGVIGLSHSHVNWLWSRPHLNDIEIVGIVEPNKELSNRFATNHGFSMDMVYTTMEELVAAKKPEAVTAFGSIYEHLPVVEFFAPLGIHVMVEKPLAVSLEHAQKMKALAEKHNIHLLTNYETTWYPTNHKAYDMVKKGEIGELRKIVVHDGHEGPKEIGVNKEFLEWLTDPVLNGGGALMDFGCYGANLITWLMNNERPLSVTAITQTIKPDIYPKVDDEATIVVTYPKMQGIIQASWNWPMGRKDMEVYGKTGYIISEDRHNLRYRINKKDKEQHEVLEERPAPYADPFSVLAAVVRKEITLPQDNLYSLKNNIVAMEILEAARESAKTGKTISLKH
ncbi:Gfo/Idh/MocA family oxidoreductase [Aurantibacter crassamenti]|uniref:Gfo/Idh/MocA family protein n=1 Tax=Aurantibacter crassamenti TaxID=1837375 RepID=UPI001939AB83|nr:Gfo/Idh/MocA family oxidoreductase [Aurantibacter crassamenti]MBM1106163.1 Gfo/Idh/MocA family oxidoreductase [Aurantibacter crassamenti]